MCLMHFKSHLQPFKQTPIRGFPFWIRRGIKVRTRSLKAVKSPTLKSSSKYRRTLSSVPFSSSICCYSNAASCDLSSGDRLVSGSKGRLKNTLRTILRGEEVWSEGAGMRQTGEGEPEWQKLQHADQKLPICQSKQPSLQQRQRPTIWGLIIDNLRLCCFLTPVPSISLFLYLSLSLSLSLSLTLLVLLFPFPEIRHGAPTWKPPTCVWVCHEPFLLSVPRGAPYHPAPPHPRPSVAMAPARWPQGPSYLHSSACSTLDVDTIQPSFASQKRRHAVKHSRS